MTSVAVITGIFFIIGITVGVISVIAISALRRDGRDGPGDWPGDGPNWPNRRPPGPDWDGPRTEQNQWWQARDSE
jgi:hypothetical protein